MSLKTIEVEIVGLSPLLMHRFPLEPVEALEKKTPEEQAEVAAYRDEKSGQLYIPAIALQRAFINGATFSKGKGRATLQKPLAACLFVGPENLLLGTKEFSLDARAVVVPATRGRIVRFRPRLDNWQVRFEVTFDDALITEKQFKQIVDDTGSRVGILDFRPEKKGPFGRFMVTSWEVQDE